MSAGAAPSRPFSSHKDWLERAIEEARDRGDFDDLPGHGQPLHIERNHLAPEWDMAFRVLKNAGFAPVWMELSKQIEVQRAELQEFLDWGCRDLEERRARLEDETRRQEEGQDRSFAAHKRRRWLFRLRRRRVDPAVVPAVTSEWSQLEAMRQQYRKEYLERATRLDVTIVAYHRELPDDLWRLQHGRRTPEVASAVFDAACPPLDASRLAVGTQDSEERLASLSRM